MNTADRMAHEWFNIQTAPTCTITKSNRIFDSRPAAHNPRSYYLPSLAVNNNSDVVIGCSGSSASASDYIGGYYVRSSGSGASMTAPAPYWAGSQSSTLPRWGDFSYTSLDRDGTTIWTIQEYAYSSALWGTAIAAIKPFMGGL